MTIETKKFAVIENGIVINTIIADSKSIAEEVTGLTCVEYTTEQAETGGTYSDGSFVKKQPFASWVLVDGEWEAPVAPPTQIDPENPVPYVWDEDSVSWIEVE